MTTNLDLAKVVAQYVELQAVSLASASVNASIDPMSLPDDLKLRQGHRASYSRSGESGERLLVVLEFDFHANDEKEGETAQEVVGLEAVFHLRYSLPPGTDCPAEALEQFAWLNGAYNAWPYWRELVQTVTGRVGLAAVTVPVFRPKVKSVDKVEKE